MIPQIPEFFWLIRQERINCFLRAWIHVADEIIFVQHDVPASFYLLEKLLGK